MKLPLTATEYYAYNDNSVPSVKSIKRLTITETKMGKNGSCRNAQLYNKLSV